MEKLLQARRRSVQLREQGICDKVEDKMLADAEQEPSINTVMKRKMSLPGVTHQPPMIDKEEAPRK